MDEKKSGNPWGVIFVLATIGGLVYLGYTHPEYPATVMAFFKEASGGAKTSEPFISTLGTEEDPFDWSSQEKQIATAPMLPNEGAQVYVKTVSGNVRLIKAGEIKYAKDAYAKQHGTVSQNKPGVAVSSTVSSPKKQDVPPSSGVTSQRQESSPQKYTPYIPEPSVIIYYGANIGLFPPKIRDWIVNEAFAKDKMEGNGKADPQLSAWWSSDGNSVQFEASYTVGPGYIDAGTRKIWGTEAHYSGTNLQSYGKYAKYQTLRFKYDLKREVEYLIEHDPAYAELINFAKQLCREIEYDWTNFSAYHGARPIKTSGMRYAVCDGYSDEVLNKSLSLKCVKSVEKWTSPGHAWNVINLVDGRTLYFDLTWFDNEHINEQTGKIYQTDDYDWEDITFNEELFRYSNIGYGTETFCHDQGKFNKTVRKL